MNESASKRSAALRQPHWQLAGVATLAFLLAALVIFVGVRERGNRVRELDRLDEQLVPAAAALSRANLHLARTESALRTLQAGGDLDRQQSVLQEVREEASAMSNAWETYRRRAGGVTGEAAPRRQFTEALDVYQRTQTPSIAARLGVGTDSPAIREADAATATMAASLDRLSDLYDNETRLVAANLGDRTEDAQTVVVLLAVLASLALGAAVGSTFVSMRRRHRAAVAREEAHARDAARSQLETNLQRAFEMVRTEEDTFAIVGEALEDAVSYMHVELLLADSSRAHFRHALTNGNDDYPGCDVADPRQCPATSRTQTYQFPSSSALAACPYLRERGVECSATCVPVSIAGKSIAVLHAVGPNGKADYDTIETLELVARRTGERLGGLRAFARTEAQARTDPLTGLLNRRSLEHDVRDLTEDSRTYVVAYGDIDHFKQLNDQHGHDTGDRALRLFSRVLRDCVRPTDLPARYGGEEFVVVLPDASVTTAKAVVERFRGALQLALADSSLPGFTVSFGIAAARPGHAFGEVVEAADAALLQAKEAGRNRVVMGDVLTQPV
jgi:diguanylate cyclase (GGDEF)-like protein